MNASRGPNRLTSWGRAAAAAAGVAVLALAAGGWTQTLYLESDISSALAARDAYISQLGLDPQAACKGLTSSGQAEALANALSQQSDRLNPWYNPYSGIAAAADPATAAAFFRTALAESDSSPGTVWVIYYELLRGGQPAFADKALSQIEKQILARGALSTPAIAQQLMHLAAKSEAEGHSAQASAFWRRAEDFDPLSPWPRVRGALVAPKQKLQAVGEALTAVGTMLRTSWQAQLVVADNLLVWLLRVAQILTIGVFVALLLKYFRRALHPFVEILPQSVPSFLRALLVASVVASFWAFGAIVFVWVLAFLLWPYMLQRERLLAGLCLVAIAVSPAGALASSSVRANRSPQNAPCLFTKALHEGFYPDLHGRIAALVRSNPDDRLATVAYAVSALKADSLDLALAQAKKALALAPDDPVAMNVLGIVDFRLGHKEAARGDFEECIRQYPGHAPAYFNLGKCLLDALETLRGAELIGQSSRLGGAAVDNFVKKNDAYFGDTWPPLRRFLIGDYPVRYYWRTVFGAYAGTWANAGEFWGATFLGLSPLLSLAAFVLLLMVLVVREGMASAAVHSRVRKVLICELCGAAMCKKCCRGPYCRSCYAHLAAIQVEQKRQAAKLHVHVSARRRETVGASVLDAAFPGAGMLFEGRNRRVLAGPVAVLTASLYGLAVALAGSTYGYPLWVAGRLYVPLYALAAVYLVVFLIRAVVKTRRALSSEEV